MAGSYRSKNPLCYIATFPFIQFSYVFIELVRLFILAECRLDRVVSPLIRLSNAKRFIDNRTMAAGIRVNSDLNV
jgi:hypothetical protein